MPEERVWSNFATWDRRSLPTAGVVKPYGVGADTLLHLSGLQIGHGGRLEWRGNRLRIAKPEDGAPAAWCWRGGELVMRAGTALYSLPCQWEAAVALKGEYGYDLEGWEWRLVGELAYSPVLYDLGDLVFLVHGAHGTARYEGEAVVTIGLPPPEIGLRSSGLDPGDLARGTYSYYYTLLSYNREFESMPSPVLDVRVEEEGQRINLAGFPNTSAGADLFGFANVGGTFYSTRNTVRGSLFTAPADAYAVSITVWLELGGASNHFVKCALYRHSDLALVAGTEEKELTPGNQWHTFLFPQPVGISEATEYVLCAWSDEGVTTCGVRADGGVAQQGHTQSLVYGAWPEPLVPVHSTNKVSIYCNYELPTAMFKRLYRAQTSDTSPGARGAHFALVTELPPVQTVYTDNRPVYALQPVPGLDHALPPRGGIYCWHKDRAFCAAPAEESRSYGSQPLDIGESSVGGLNQTIEDTIAGSVLTPQLPGFAQAVNARLTLSDDHTVKAAVYRQEDLVLLAETEERTLGAADSGWCKFEFRDPLRLTAETSYVVVLWANATAGTCTVAYAVGAANQGYGDSLGYGAWPDPLDADLSTNRCSIYLNGLVTQTDAAKLGNVLYWSELAEPYYWPGQNYVRVGADDPITALASWRDQLYIFKAAQIWVLSGYDRDTWVLEKLADCEGVLADYGESQAQVAVGAEGVVWCSRQGVYAYDGTEIVQVLPKGEQRGEPYGWMGSMVAYADHTFYIRVWVPADLTWHLLRWRVDAGTWQDAYFAAAASAYPRLLGESAGPYQTCLLAYMPWVAGGENEITVLDLVQEVGGADAEGEACSDLYAPVAITLPPLIAPPGYDLIPLEVWVDGTWNS